MSERLEKKKMIKQLFARLVSIVESSSVNKPISSLSKTRKETETIKATIIAWNEVSFASLLARGTLLAPI